MGQFKDSIKVVLVTLSIPFVIMAADFLVAVSKLIDQGWRYFIPTYSGLADAFQMVSMVAMFAAPIFIEDIATFAEVGVWMTFWMVVPGLLVPYLIEVYGDRQDRDKVFEFARLRANREGET